MDLLLETKDDIFVIEMNPFKKSGLDNRNYLYTTLIGATRAQQMKNYTDAPKIKLYNFNNFKTNANNKYIVEYKLRSEDNIVKSDIIKILDIDMEIIRNACYNKPIYELSSLEKYVLLITSKTKGELVKFKGDDKFMDKFIKLSEQFNEDKVIIGEYDVLREQELFLNSAKIEAKIEGKAEGKAEGIKEGIINTAINLLKNNVDKSIISKSTGLSIDEINNLIQY